MKTRPTPNKLLFQLFFLALFAFSITSCHTSNQDITTKIVKVDSVSIWIQNAKNVSLDFGNRKQSLYKAYQQNNLQKNDSVKNSNLAKIAYEGYELKDSVFFLKANLEAQKLSIKLRDTFGIADTHWSYGMYYLENEILDSAYYHYYEAYKYFQAAKHNFFSGKMLYNMAIIQQDAKDYTGSEVLTFQAISIFKKLQKYNDLYLCYNLLGTIFKQMQEYDNAIMYHTKAMEILKNIEKNGTYKESSLNNLALVYQKQGDYKMAIAYFNKALKNKNLKIQDINLYSKIIDNLAYTKFLSGDTVNVLHDYNKSLYIRDSLNYISGVITSKLHLAEFYMKYGDTAKALLHAEEAHKLAEDVSNNRDVLASLLLLSKLDTKNANNYFKNYAALNESLLTEERKIRDKFTRIRFETDEYIEETEMLSEQKMKISIASVLAILILSLLYFLKVQRTKNKELLFEKEQQKANEEIYSLMLMQQSSLEEGRLKERQRISEDLHDGVLGKIFGTRLALGFLNINGDDETITKHKLYVDELQNIEKEIRTISHELKNEILSSQTDFIKIVEKLLETQSEISGFDFKIMNNKAAWDTVDNKIKINFYRIIQEAIQNINKYSKAKNVKIAFDLIEDSVCLIIEDDGVGFDADSKSNGIGLKNMKSRVSKLNGNFDIKSAVNKGTKISIFVPVEPDNYEKSL
ncbi:MAG: tetratricopeptide repeat-containing sensor histidine kinase [Lutibacter sp.]